MIDPAAKPKGLADALEEGARDALAGIERGLVKADRALATPEGTELAALLDATNLPELPTEGPLGSLGVRLDREADLLRNVALRELGRVAWMDRLGLIVVLVGFFLEAVIAACVTFSAIVGALDGRGGLFTLAATVIAGSAAGVSAVVSRSRSAHRDLANEALSRARAIEERIFQLAVVMEWRGAGDTLYQDALARLERSHEPSASGQARATE